MRFDLPFESRHVFANPRLRPSGVNLDPQFPDVGPPGYLQRATASPTLQVPMRATGKGLECAAQGDVQPTIADRSVNSLNDLIRRDICGKLDVDLFQVHVLRQGTGLAIMISACRL